VTRLELLDPNVWRPLRQHAEQQRFWRSDARFQLALAGRRSGKTAIAKRKTIIAALQFTAAHDGRFVFAAPTRDQARKIYWDDLKRMVPRQFVKQIREDELLVQLVTDTKIEVVGLDAPARVEGSPLDWIVMDEVDDTKPIAWPNHVRPALDTDGRPSGRAIFIGKPKGRKILHALYTRARSGEEPGWEVFRWKSSEIIDPERIAAAKRDLDARTYAQEYDAEFVDFEGRVYYSFEAALHAVEPLPYLPDDELVFAFDFNVKPGIAEVLQEQRYTGTNPRVGGEVTASIGEVWIPENSTTPAVVRKLIADWGTHTGPVLVYGDATGGAKGTAKVDGSDWEIIERMLRHHFGARVRMRVPSHNPLERVRVNSANSRLLNIDGVARWLIDPRKCPHLVDDLESVVSLAGSDGEIDKKSYPSLTHCSDAATYYIERRHSIVKHTITTTQL
jgi:hypothetical protein